MGKGEPIFSKLNGEKIKQIPTFCSNCGQIPSSEDDQVESHAQEKIIEVCQPVKKKGIW
ncbi:hypothetical protein KSD_69660 [Ktedonobacter sp. SOSP1-85]|nr:hypothetical protein KSD_69660 [Ktedonobacter sp. SOSP1-85]